MPRVVTETYSGGGDFKWLASDHAITNASSGSLVFADFKSLVTADGEIPSGTAVDCSDYGRLKPWTNTAGQQLGFILTGQPVKDLADASILNVPVIWHGKIRTKLLPQNIAWGTGTSIGFTLVTQDRVN